MAQLLIESLSLHFALYRLEVIFAIASTIYVLLEKRWAGNYAPLQDLGTILPIRRITSRILPATFSAKCDLHALLNG